MWPAAIACSHLCDAPGRNRTCDLALRRRALYPLSYGRGEAASLASEPWSGAEPGFASTRSLRNDARVVLLDVNQAYTDAVTTVFSTPIAAKAWFATAALVLVVVQVLTASRMWGRIGRLIPLRVPVVARIHRWSGRLAFLCTLPVFFHCVFILGWETTSTRVVVHALAGSFVYGVFAAKVLIVRSRAYPHWVPPVVGGTLAATLVTLWLTSSLWYFTNVRFGF